MGRVCLAGLLEMVFCESYVVNYFCLPLILEYFVRTALKLSSETLLNDSNDDSQLGVTDVLKVGDLTGLEENLGLADTIAIASKAGLFQELDTALTVVRNLLGHDRVHGLVALPELPVEDCK